MSAMYPRPIGAFGMGIAGHFELVALAWCCMGKGEANRSTRSEIPIIFPSLFS